MKYLNRNIPLYSMFLHRCSKYATHAHRLGRRLPCTSRLPATATHTLQAQSTDNRVNFSQGHSTKMTDEISWDEDGDEQMKSK